MASNGRRGGARQRRWKGRVAKDGLGPVDRDAISNLLEDLAPAAPVELKSRALAIVVKGIEVHRENAPTEQALKGAAKDSRRALQRFQKNSPFNSFGRVGGRYVGCAADGLYWLDGDTDGGTRFDQYAGLEKALSDPLRTLSICAQLAAGFQGVNPGLAFNPLSGVGEDGAQKTVGSRLLDELAHPRDWDAELAGHVYLAITRGLCIAATEDWHEPDEPDSAPRRRSDTWNYGRLLVLAAAQAGVPLPRSRAGMKGLMDRGRACADEMLMPAVTFPDGREVSHFDAEFPED